MLAYRHPYIALEGWKIIGIILVFNVVLSYFLQNAWTVPGWLIFIFSLLLYRDPSRVIPPLPLALVAPVDGIVRAIDSVDDPFIERQACRIVIDMRLLDVHSARSPTEGKVMNQWHGMNRDTRTDKESSQSEMPDEKHSQNFFAQWVQTDEGDDVVIRMQQRYAIQRSRCYVQSGERIGQGQRCGFVPFGAIVEVYIPQNSRIDVKVGDKVSAGSKVIATLVRQAKNTAVPGAESSET